MAATDGEGFALASSIEEVVLRRRLLFRLLRDFDFQAPAFAGEPLYDPGLSTPRVAAPPAR